MNQESKLSKMNQKLIESKENYIFYCNNCKNEFDHVVSFFPIQGLSEYYTCKFCNSILPIKDLKTSSSNWNKCYDTFCTFCTFCCYF